MSVRFKFRSSAHYDSVDIGGLPSISVRDLKSRIVQNKKLNLCLDFDLLFSDPISGQEHVDEDFQIPRDSSVIIKRVPAGARVSLHKKFATTDTNIRKTSHPENVETVNFDDFGAELCPVPEGNLSRIDLDMENKFCIGDEKTNIKLKRWSEQPVVECHKFEVSDISEAIPLGLNASETKSKPDIELNTKLSEVVIRSFPAMQTTDFPSEMKCSLCYTFFKEAVMIPCCQHSFCDKCICHVLVEKARCPKCFSTKCKVEDLLPNVSLRQAIERFLKSQILINGLENALHRYAPDGESGIQVNDVSCDVSVLQRGAELPPSPCATGRGSNQVPVESMGGVGSHFNGNHLLKDQISKLPVHKMLQLPEDLEGFADFQGENQPINEEAEFNVKKKRALWVNTAEKSYVENGRLKKGDRACYMCGSPGHLRRDCPAVSSPHPMLQRGNAMFPGAMPGFVSVAPYWNGPPFPHIMPFVNPYGNSGMMPFNSTVIPAAPFPVPTYMPTMFSASPAFGGFTRMGGIAAATKNNIDHQLFRSNLDAQDYDKRHQFTNENVMRKHFYGEDDVKRPQYDEAERTCDKKFNHEKERSASYSEDSFTKKSLKKHWHPHNIDDDIYSDDERHEKSSQVVGQNPRPYHHSKRSRSEVDDMPGSPTWHSEERHRHGHRSSKKHRDHDSDSSWTHYPTNKEKDVKRTVKHDSERQHQKHYNHSESSMEPNHSTDQKKKRREKDSSRSSRHSGHKAKSAIDELSHGRWQMASRSDEDNQEDYQYYRRKRVY
ncbi:E3 ubiquitin ligase PARAQUAT TOLERANCE 3-like isoform X2 [Durio zibethinus]|uniref:E3 ubiquitin ligase PARAQUAT TOLERANCE 3-like isoform X2 n=1 Tax=Durio zibethinus TaxID=66656 RepID=A0A6P5XT94_DURZI|nr:E3 ubiquitin ligase PARAQUAT TOLERANCE 3-like isoform X2 [Durio zibethinus]